MSVVARISASPEAGYTLYQSCGTVLFGDTKLPVAIHCSAASGVAEELDDRADFVSVVEHHEHVARTQRRPPIGVVDRRDVEERRVDARLELHRGRIGVGVIPGPEGVDPRGLLVEEALWAALGEHRVLGVADEVGVDGGRSAVDVALR